MANYRLIHTQIWKDEWFVDLTPEEKILFVYLFSNEASSFIGLYKITVRVMAFETGLSYTQITDILKKFEEDGKAIFRDGIIWVVKMWQYHKNPSNTVMIRFEKDLALIPHCPLKDAYQIYQDTGLIDIDTLSIPYPYPPLKKERKKEVEVEPESEEPATSTSVLYLTGPEAIAERIYQLTTGAFTIPSAKRPDIITVTLRYYEKYQSEDAAAEALKPYAREWKERNYPMTNPAWILEWAAQGVIPPVKPKSENGKPHQPTLAEQGFTNVTEQRLAKQQNTP